MAKKNAKVENVTAVYVKQSQWAEAIAAEHRLALVQKNFVRLGDTKCAEACAVLIKQARTYVDAHAQAAMKNVGA